MRAWLIPLMLLVAGLFPDSFKADTLRARDGRLYNGRFAGIVGEQYQFETPQGMILVGIAGAELQIGASGVRGCIRRYSVTKPDCSGHIFAISKATILVGFPAHDGSFASARIDSATVESITFENVVALPVIEGDLMLRLATRDADLEATWVAVRPNGVRISVRGKEQEIALSDIYRLTILPPSDLPRPDPPLAIRGTPIWLWPLPGVPAFFRGDKLRGFLISAGTLGFGMAAGHEYLQATRVVRDARRDPLFQYFRSLAATDYESRYANHLRRHYAFSFIAVLSFGYHLWDTYERGSRRLGSEAEASGASVQLHASSAEPRAVARGGQRAAGPDTSRWELRVTVQW